MKYLILVFLYAFCAHQLQAQLVENFDDGELLNNPSWIGTLQDFEINADGELQLNSAMAGTAFLQTQFESTALQDKEWRLDVELDFSPSGNNFAQVFLASADENYETCYFLQLGESGSADAIRLFYRSPGNDDLEILSDAEGSISAAFEYSVKITVDQSGLWSFYSDYSGGQDYILQTSATHTPTFESSYLGLNCTYTISNANDFYFDNIYFGDFIVDTAPPELINVEPNSLTELLVSFSENIDFDGLAMANFSVLPSTSPSAVEMGPSENQVVLTFANPLPANQNLTLESSGVPDLAGNVSVQETFEFFNAFYATPNAGDIVFNEILADPTPSSGLPEAEYLELYNTSTTEFFQLSALNLYNTNTLQTLGDFVLGPQEYVVLCNESDAADFEVFGAVLGLESFSALANSGDSLTLTLQDAEETVLDWVAYEDNWYTDAETAEGGFSLERKNPSEGCSSASNWASSTNLEGGTPGGINSVFDATPDQSAPEILAVSLGDDAATLVVLFSENVLADEVVATLSEGNPAVVSSTWIAGNTLLISLGAGFVPGTEATLTISDVQDCAGNSSGEITFDFLIGFTPEIGDLIISEILPDPTPSEGLPEVEFVELYNNSEKLLELLGVVVGGEIVNVPYLLEPGAFVFLHRIEDDFAFFFFENHLGIEGVSENWLVGSGELLEILAPNETVLDRIDYDLSWYNDSDKDNGGWSLERINPTLVCSDASNWSASNAAVGGTPGQQNSIWNTTQDTEAPALSETFFLSPDSMLVVFDEPLDPVSLVLLSFSVQAPYAVESVVFGENEREVIVVLDAMASAGEVVTFTCSGAIDCQGNEALELSGSPILPQEAIPGDVLINEILSNPFGTGSDFVEIINVTDKVLSLKNWALGTKDGESLDELAVLSERTLILPPNGILAFSRDPQNVVVQYPFAAAERILPLADLNDYNNSEDVVVLVHPNGEVSDLLEYDEEMHFAILDDLDGVSLERLDALRSAEDRGNWHSAAESQGFATPGYENSQALSTLFAGAFVSVAPPLFSPDGDGFEDLTNLICEFDRTELVGNLTVFDAVGRPIRRLANNQLLGVREVFTWNGTTDQGQLAPLGQYIFYLEVFDAEGNVAKWKKAVALVHQLD